MFKTIKNWLFKLRFELALRFNMPSLFPFVIAGGTTAYSDLSSDAVTYIGEKTLLIAHKIVRFYELADKAKLPSQNSKTFQYTRYERLALPQSQLSDGVTPSDTSMTISTVTAIAEQWGAVVTLTDVAELTIRHKPLQKAIYLLGVQSAEVVDRNIFQVLMGGTNVFYVGATAGRISIATTDYLGSSTLAKIVASLRDYGAMGIDKPKGGPAEDPELGDDYAAVVDSFVEQDIATGDTDFKAANVYSNTKVLWNGEIGNWKGFRFMRSNLIPTLTSATAASTGTGTTTGTVTDAYYTRIMVTATDNTFGFEKVIYQSSEQRAGTSANTNTITVTIPSTTGYTYSVYAGPSATGQVGVTSAATAMYLQGSGFAPAAALTLFSDSGTASATHLVFANTTAAPAQLLGTTSKVHISFFIGKEAFTCVDLMNLQSTLTPATASDSDPLIQRRKAGWKTMFKAVINNQNFFARCECESLYD